MNGLVHIFKGGFIMTNIETLLHEEIQDGFDALSRMERGTKIHKTTVDEVVKLFDKAIEIEKIEVETKEKAKAREIEIKKIEIEADERAKAREIEASLKMAQMEEDRKDRRFKNGIAVGGIVLPLAVTIWGTFKTLKFEEEGTVTTMMGRGFINKLIPKK